MLVSRPCHFQQEPPPPGEVYLADQIPGIDRAFVAFARGNVVVMAMGSRSHVMNLSFYFDDIIMEQLSTRGSLKQIIETPKLVLEGTAAQPVKKPEDAPIPSTPFPRNDDAIVIEEPKPGNGPFKSCEKITLLSDDADNRILECAVSGGADLIVIGDKEMLHLKSYKGIKIISLKQYLF